MPGTTSPLPSLRPTITMANLGSSPPPREITAKDNPCIFAGNRNSMNLTKIKPAHIPFILFYHNDDYSLDGISFKSYKPTWHNIRAGYIPIIGIISGLVKIIFALFIRCRNCDKVTARKDLSNALLKRGLQEFFGLGLLGIYHYNQDKNITAKYEETNNGSVHYIPIMYDESHTIPRNILKNTQLPKSVINAKHSRSIVKKIPSYELKELSPEMKAEIKKIENLDKFGYWFQVSALTPIAKDDTTNNLKDIKKWVQSQKN